MAPAGSNANLVDIGGEPESVAVESGVVSLAGRIDSVRLYEGKHYTRVLMPAPDEWAGPGTVEIRSVERIGGEGSMVTVRARVGGYTQSGKTKQGEPFTKTVMTLDHVRG